MEYQKKTILTYQKNIWEVDCLNEPKEKPVANTV